MISWENPWGASRDVLYRIRTLPSFMVWSLLGFVSGWVQTRRIAALIIGLPSLVIASLVIATTLKARAGLTTETILRYVDNAQQHLKNNQIEQAEFYMSRLRSLKYQTDPLLVTSAEIESRRDRPDLSETCYRQMLANQDHTLDALAHQKLALIELKASQTGKPTGVNEAIFHFQQALLADPADLVSHELLARLFINREDFSSAIQHLELVAQRKPAVNLELARMYKKLDRQTMSVESAARAEKYFREELTKEVPPTSEVPETKPSPAHRTNLTLNIVEAQVLQNKLDDAAKLATDALDRDNSPELRKRLATIYLMKANSLPATDAAWARRWEFVALSRNYDPDSPESLSILANIAANAPAKLRQLAIQEITPYLDNERAPSSAYFLVGTAAAQDKQWDMAAKLLKKSVETNPETDAGWNNLAHVLISQTPPDWAEAERCVNEALRLNASPPRFHQTRGQVMIGLKKWAEAARELEIARSGITTAPEIHLGLAEAYGQLGDDDLAAFHRSRYETMTR